MAPGSYITPIDIDYKCKDWSTHTTSTKVFEVQSFAASVSESDPNIAQDLTATALRYNNGSGHPIEQPLAVVVWDTPGIQPDEYEELGVGVTHKLGSLIYASDLGLGSVVHTTSPDQQSFVLNSGLLVVKMDAEVDVMLDHEGILESLSNTSSRSYKTWLFLSEAKKYSRKTKVKLSNALYRTVMSAALSSAKLNLRHIFQTQCRLRQLVEATRIHQHKNNPNGGDLLETNNGEVLEIVGDLVRVSKCKEVINFTIIWSRKWKGTCITEFPVNISGQPNISFVDIQSRRLVKIPSNIPCETLPKEIFLRDDEGNYFEVGRQGSIRKTSMRFDVDQLVSEVKINRARNWDQFETEDTVPTASILQILQRAIVSMIDITRMTKSKALTSAIMGEVGEVLSVIGRGTGGLMADIGSIFGDIFGGIASGSVQVVRSITDGARGIVTDTAGILSSGISHILMVINNILQWIGLPTLFGKAFAGPLRRRFIGPTTSDNHELAMHRAPVPLM
jgi:hypothetical protein